MAGYPDGTGRVAVIGTGLAVQGFGLAGAVVFAADDPAAVGQAWASLPPDVAVVILTADAAAVVGDLVTGATSPLVTVVPP